MVGGKGMVMGGSGSVERMLVTTGGAARELLITGGGGRALLLIIGGGEGVPVEVIKPLDPVKTGETSHALGSSSSSRSASLRVELGPLEVVTWVVLMVSVIVGLGVGFPSPPPGGLPPPGGIIGGGTNGGGIIGGGMGIIGGNPTGSDGC